jgi:hypothetical protein
MVRLADIVVSRYNKPTEWTDGFLNLGIKKTNESTEKGEVKVFVYDKANPANPYNVPVNKGNEASVYLKHIIDFYDDLAEYTYFIHDEEYSWHHHGSVIDLFEDAYAILCESPMMGFYNVNHFMMQTLYHNIYIMEILQWYQEYIEEYVPFDSLESEDFTLGHKGAAQFLVKREAIVRLPKLCYERLYQWLITTDIPSDISGRFLEWTWHTLFREPS